MEVTIGIRREHGIWADLRIANRGDDVVRIHNPGNPRLSEGWEYSPEAYRVALLRSFDFLRMTLRANDGSVIEPLPIFTRADPVVGLPLTLDPGAELVLPVPLHEFYDLQPGAEYSLALTYGDDNCRVSAEAPVRA